MEIPNRTLSFAKNSHCNKAKKTVLISQRHKHMRAVNLGRNVIKGCQDLIKNQIKNTSERGESRPASRTEEMLSLHG